MLLKFILSHTHQFLNLKTSRRKHNWILKSTMIFYSPIIQIIALMTINLITLSKGLQGDVIN